jgi:D-amino-acid dehydrogenase
LIAGLAAELRARGAELREEAPVRAIRRRGGGWSVDLEGATETADAVVVAAGVASAGLLAPYGARLPLEGAKGYSLTLEEPPIDLRGPVYLLESKVGVSPFAGALRLAGTLELGTRGLGLSAGRIASIREAGEAALNGWNGKAQWRTWAGFRPLLPDGLPAIGPVPGQQGLHVATGHAMLGVTLAPTTAALLAPVVLDGKPSLELAPFSIARFDNRGGGAIATSTEERR